MAPRALFGFILGTLWGIVIAKELLPLWLAILGGLPLGGLLSWMDSKLRDKW